MGHSNQRIIDTNLKKIKYFLFVVILYISGCDFRMPQKWETPQWMLPLTIPLSADTILVADLIATGYTCPYNSNPQQYETLLECNETCIDGTEPGGCTPINTIEADSIDYFFTYNQDVITEEEAVEVPADLFTVEALGELPISVDPINILISSTEDIPDIEISEEILMTDFFPGDLPALECIPFTEFDQPELEALDPILPYTQVDQMVANGDIPYVETVNHIIANGYAQLTVTNSLPFVLDIEFQLNDENSLWISNQITSLQPGNTDSDPESLVSDIIPREINIVPIINVSNPETCDVYYPLSLFEVPDEQCPALFIIGLANSSSPGCQLTVDNQQACEQQLENFINFDDFEQYDCSNCEFQWIDGECQIDANEKGWDAPSNINSAKINFEYDFVINGGALDVSINMTQTINGEQQLNLSEQEGAEGVDLIGAEFSNTPDDDEINKLNLKFRNNLFSEIDLILDFPQFYDLNGDVLVIDIENEPINEDRYFVYDFSLHTIGASDATANDLINGINYIVTANLVEENAIIQMDTSYDFEFIDAILSSFKFENLRVKLQEFDTGDEPFEMVDLPAGFSGFELPDLGFEINFYNEINAPIQVNLDIAGLSEEATIEDCGSNNQELCSKVTVLPEIKYYGNENSIIDTSIIRVKENFVEVVQFDRVLMETLIDTFYFKVEEGEDSLTIYDVFEMDHIDVSGTAILDGEGTLEPGRKVWADMEIMVDPLSLIITENITFISEVPNEITPISNSEDSQIDSAVISFTIENGIPLDGNISMIISDSEIFPICLDTLVAGNLSEQEDNISKECYNSISDQFFSGSDINIVIDDLSSINDFHYIEFDDCVDGLSNCKSHFFGKFANIPLQDPVLNEDGIVISSVTYIPEPVQLLGDEFEWFSKADILYISPQVTLLSSEDKRTLQSINYLIFNSNLMLIMDMHEVIE